MRLLLGASLAAFVLAGPVAAQQLGAATRSSPPAGVQPGQGAANPFRPPQSLILNFALGGDWGGPIDDSVLPQKFLIDYVRVYQSAESHGVADENSPR